MRTLPSCATTGGSTALSLLARLTPALLCEQVLTEIFAKDPEQQEFMQAVREVAVSLQPVFEKRPELLPIFKQARGSAVVKQGGGTKGGRARSVDAAGRCIASAPRSAESAPMRCGQLYMPVPVSSILKSHPR